MADEGESKGLLGGCWAAAEEGGEVRGDVGLG
jgi:hypothetical protein